MILIQMLSDFYRIVTNTIYGVARRKKRFEAQNLEERVLAAGATKARKVRGSSAKVQHEAGWIVARRGILLLTNSRLICGSWDIPLSSIQSANLLKVKAFLAKGFVLKVSTENEHYQFGLQYDPAWESQTALPLIVEESKIGYSVFSIIVRIIFLIFLGLYIIENFL